MSQEKPGSANDASGIDDNKVRSTYLSRSRVIFVFALFLVAFALFFQNGHFAGLAIGDGEGAAPPLVMFKGQGLIEAPIRDIFVVLYDTDHKKKLLDKTVDFRIIDTHSKSEFTVYNHMDSPFIMVSDRDVILRTGLVFDPKSHTVHAPFWSVPHKDIPHQNGIERMERCNGSWVLEYKGPNKTMVTYAVEADPGGWVPMWVVNLVNKEVPGQTIANMARQAQKKSLYQDTDKLVTERFDFDSLLGLNPSERVGNPSKRVGNALEEPERVEPSLIPSDGSEFGEASGLEQESELEEEPNLGTGSMLGAKPKL
ncbi:MAG: hypothetical protein VYA34_00780 [Myxococcota bacterium]|nr:hypothetical protein [Myxococcota bacterium]